MASEEGKEKTGVLRAAARMLGRLFGGQPKSSAPNDEAHPVKPDIKQAAPRNLPPARPGTSQTERPLGPEVPAPEPNADHAAKNSVIPSYPVTSAHPTPPLPEGGLVVVDHEPEPVPGDAALLDPPVQDREAPAALAGEQSLAPKSPAYPRCLVAPDAHYMACAEVEPAPKPGPSWPEMVGLEVLGGLTANAPADAVAGEDATKDELPLRVLAEDWWELPAARRALRRVVWRMGRQVNPAEVRVNPLPVQAPERTFDWFCAADQAELAAWAAGDPHARRAITAISQWVRGTASSLVDAFAEEFDAPKLFFALLDDLDERDWEILRRRIAGETLEACGARFGVSRARVGQIEDKVDRRVGGRLCAELRKGQPAATALQVHLRQLAFAVTEAASNAEGTLRPEDRLDWIRKALPPEEAIILGAVERSLYACPREDRPLLDYLSSVGQPLAGGRTTLRWTDADVERVRATLNDVSGPNRFAPLDRVAEALGISSEDTAILAALADIKVEDGLAFVAGFRVADLRRARAAEILRSAGRAMHYAEILVAGLVPPIPPAWNAHTVVHAMRGEPDRFETDELGLWCLKGHAPQGLDDVRPECPRTPPVAPPDELRRRIADARGRSRGGALLDGLDPTRHGFVAEVARRVAERLSVFPEGQRSVAEVLQHPEDHSLLRAWLAAPRPEPDAFAAELSDEAALGLVLSAAALAVWRKPRAARFGGWAALKSACSPEMRRALFYEKGLIQQRLTSSALVRAVVRYGLRHAFDFQCDAWATVLGLQTGFDRHSLVRILNWIDGDDVTPEAVRLLTATGRNYSASFHLLWDSLVAYRRGDLGEEELAFLAETSPWWPGWSLAEAFERLRRSSDPRPRKPQEGKQGQAAGSQEDGVGVDDSGLGAVVVALDQQAGAFVAILPDRLNTEAGPLVLSGDGFRVGGVVIEDGRVTWHGGPRIALPLRGAPSRRARLEASGESVVETEIPLWTPEDFIALYDLAPGAAEALDPYTTQVSTSGPHALLLHPSLAPSAPADDERELDQGYVLHVYRRGFPDGMSVSCDGEVLWEPRRRSDGQLVLDVAPVVLSGDAGDLNWGEACDLRSFGMPDGFIPTRAVIGSQRLDAATGNPPWRFNGFVVLPGAEPLRRRGRLEGRYHGHRASVPAVVMLRRPARGAVLRNGPSMRTIPTDSFIDRTRDADWRLWVFRDKEDGEADQLVFEGVRPAARHGMHGARLAGVLYGLGEPLSFAPTMFNRWERSIAIAAAVVDTGVVAGATLGPGLARIEFRSPIGWTDRHCVRAWGATGFQHCATERAAADGGHVVVRVPGDADVAGFSVLFGQDWLGSAHLADDPLQATARLLSGKDFCETLATAIAGRLPVLGVPCLAPALLQAIRHGPDAVRVLLRGASTTERQHLASQILARWAPVGDAAEAMVREFASALELPRSPVSLLEGLATASPCALVRVLRPGMPRLPRPEQKRLLAALIMRLLPPDLPDEVRKSISPRNPDRCGADAEEAALSAAHAATRFDRQFLSSRSEASIASQAWILATKPGTPPTLPENVATALSAPSIRRWLAIHFLSRLILQGP